MSEVAREIESLGRLYGVADRAREFLSRASRYLDRYAEIVLGESAFEVVTGDQGQASSLVELARNLGTSTATCAAFTACVDAFPDRMLGVKARIGESAQPTLYVRTLCDLSEGLCHLGPRARSALAPGLAASRTLYGLGFQRIGDQECIKTYTVADIDWDGRRTTGFLSLRMTDDQISTEHKWYVPEVSLRSITAPSSRWQRVLEFATDTLGYAEAGNVGYRVQDGRAPELAVYVERVGAIPSDFSAR